MLPTTLHVKVKNNNKNMQINVHTILYVLNILLATIT